MQESKTVLVIDDHPVVLEGVTMLLEVNGLKTIHSRSGLEGLELALHHHPDLIICDYRMPGLDGLAVLERLRDNPQTADIPFIFLSSSPPTTLREQYTQLGADALVLKESGSGELLSIIHQVLNQSVEK